MLHLPMLGVPLLHLPMLGVPLLHHSELKVHMLLLQLLLLLTIRILLQMMPQVAHQRVCILTLPQTSPDPVQPSPKLDV
jgi:hypothetical protein